MHQNGGMRPTIVPVSQSRTYIYFSMLVYLRLSPLVCTVAVWVRQRDNTQLASWKTRREEQTVSPNAIVRARVRVCRLTYLPELSWE